jgi:uncharacterized repeat protein (TIGR01451 family)
MKRLVSSVVLLLYSLGYCIQPVRAEGSKELVSDGGYRPFLEWTPGSTTAGIPRRTVLQVYVEAGETVNLGSSVHNSFDGQDIVFRSPSGQEKVCDVQQTGEGFIDTVDKETAGPLPNNGGYTPCKFTVTQSGVYEVEFHAPSGALTSGNNPPPTPANAAFPTDDKQKHTVAAWDITVRDSNGNNKKGRVFAKYIAMNMGNNASLNGGPADIALNSKLYIQTKDGYRYETDMNGIDPFGFIFFANSRGYIDYGAGGNGSTLYHSAGGAINNNLDFPGNVKVQSPFATDTETDITHLVFFNRPDLSTLTALSLPPAPIPPAIPSNFKFTGKSGGSGNQTPVGQGGYFSFGSTTKGSYQIIIDTDTDGIYDPSKDRVLQDPVAIGTNVIFWDGKDVNGVDLQPRPANEPYNAQVTIRGGEYHFPMLDAESNPLGFKITMENPPGAFPNILDLNKQPLGPTTFYYNDSNYTTKNGTSINLDGQGATNPRNAALGVNSSGGEHEFSQLYGDFKGMDTWIYFPSSAVFTPAVITNTKQANVRGTKSVRFLTDVDGSGKVSTGDLVKYTITYSNLTPGNSDAINFAIADSLPPQLSFVSAAIDSQTAGNNIVLNPNYQGSGALTNSGTLRVGDSITISITARIIDINNSNPISNQASATFNTPDNPATNGTILTDADSAGGTSDTPTVGNPFVQKSDDGVNTGNDPSTPSDDDPTLFTAFPGVNKPNILLVKRITAINGSTSSKGGDNLGGYINEAANPYDDNDIEPNLAPKPSQYPTADTNAWPNPSSFLIGGINGGNVSPNNELEYTIYFLSAGNTPAPKVLLCDRIPDNTTFIPTAFNSISAAPSGVAGADRGILVYQNGTAISLTDVKDGDAGQYFPPGVDPKTIYPKIDCGGANSNGAIVVNLGDVPNATGSGTPPSSFGYIRFRGKVK